MEPGSRPRLGHLFVSSVFGELLPLREQVADAAQSLGFHPLLTEKIAAWSGAVAARVETELARCDTYVGLFSKRRGTVPRDEARAITEQEFLLARRLGRKCLVFIERGREAERDAELQRFLNDEVASYRGGVYPWSYASEDELELGFAAALSNVRPRADLSIARGAHGLEGRLFLGGMRPALRGGPDVLGPFPFDPDLPSSSAEALHRFLEGSEARARLAEDALVLVGAELWAKLSEAAQQHLLAALDLAHEDGQRVVLRIRSREPEVLALPWELLHHPKHRLPVKRGLVELVRFLPPEGSVDDPLHDPPTLVPAREFSVLGFTAEPLEDEAGGAALGSLGLQSDQSLFWEVEQERLLLALDPILSHGRGRLVLPDSGDCALLQSELAKPGRPAVLHLSCHGGPFEHEGRRQQVVFLEDEEGHRAAASAAELLAWTRAGTGRIELALLSACYTAAQVAPAGPSRGARQVAHEVHPDGRAASFAEQLVRGGLPRVLGMQTSVSDRGAIAFAEALYAEIGAGHDLVQAMAAGRAVLRDRGLEHEWAIPVLLTSEALGPLAAPASRQPRTATPLELVRQGFAIGEVTYLAQGYVGRRFYERRLFRAWRDGARMIAIHGLGGIGKSTLAARFLERRASEGVRVLVLPPGERSAAALLEDVAERLRVARPEGVEPKQAETALRTALQTELRRVRTLLLLDNFEDNQDEGTGELADPALGSALVDLARLGGQELCLVFTTRRALELEPGPLAVQNLDLGALSPAECRKLKLLLPGLRAIDAESWKAVLERIGGHPKALELLAGYVLGNPDRLAQLRRKLEQAVQHVEAALGAKEQERGRALLLDAVIEAVPAERLPALDRLSLLRAPLPTEELVALVEADGVATAADDLAWLRERGLIARTVSPEALAGGDAVHRLVASRRASAVTTEVARAFHAKLAEHFVERPGLLSDLGQAAFHRDQSGDRAGALELYGRWIKRLRDGHAYRAADQVADEALRALPPGDDEAACLSAAWLCMYRFDVLVPLGQVQDAERHLDKARSLLGLVDSTRGALERASESLRRGQLLTGRGKSSEARSAFEDARKIFGAGGHSRDEAIALGHIARLEAQAGNVERARELHDERLKLFEQIGDVHSRTVTLGEIARLEAQAGNVGRARKLHDEALAVYQQLGDVRSRAVTLGDIARLEAQAGNVERARRLHDERLAVYLQLGEVRERAVTLGDIARLEAQAGNVKRARKLHDERLAVYLQLGDVRSRAVTLGDIARLEAQAGNVERARKLQEERLRVNRSLQDVDGIAAACFDLAQLDLEDLRFEPARERLAEAWALFLKLGRIDGIAAVGSLYGQLLVGSGAKAEGIAVLERAQAAWIRLGQAEHARQLEELLTMLRAQP